MSSDEFKKEKIGLGMAIVKGLIAVKTCSRTRYSKEKCLAAGMNAHLAKPVKIENVKKILCDYSV